MGSWQELKFQENKKRKIVKKNGEETKNESKAKR
jgi:hypothetical protein